MPDPHNMSAEESRALLRSYGYPGFDGLALVEHYLPPPESLAERELLPLVGGLFVLRMISDVQGTMTIGLLLDEERKVAAAREFSYNVHFHYSQKGRSIRAVCRRTIARFAQRVGVRATNEQIVMAVTNAMHRLDTFCQRVLKKEEERIEEERRAEELREVRMAAEAFKKKLERQFWEQVRAMLRDRGASLSNPRDRSDWTAFAVETRPRVTPKPKLGDPFNKVPIYGYSEAT